MTQLPSVSELLIGAHNHSGPELRPDSNIHPNFIPSNPGKRQLSETSPRQSVDFIKRPPSSRTAGLPKKPQRTPISIRACPGMTAAEPQPNAHQHHQNDHHKPPANHPGVHQSNSWNERNLVSSVGLESHPQHFACANVPVAGPQMEYIHYRDGELRPPHVLLHLLLLLPLLHYRQRQESSARSGTRATLYQGFASLECTTVQREPRLPVSELPTGVSRPRPASFSFPPQTVPGSAPGMGHHFSPPMGQPYHYSAPGAGPPPGLHHVPAMTPPQGHYAAPPPGAPYAYCAGSTAGSGYPPHFHPSAAIPGHYPGAVHGPVPVSAPGHVSNMPFNPPMMLGQVIYGHEYYPHVQVKSGPSSAPYLQVDPMSRQLPHHFPVPNPLEDLAMLATDPNHALINKRCIIKRRTRTGCLTCRKRRIKCDERKPHCYNCERSKKLCLGYEILSNSNNSCHSHSSPEVKPDTNDLSDTINSDNDLTIKDAQPPVERHRSSVHDLM